MVKKENISFANNFYKEPAIASLLFFTFFIIPFWKLSNSKVKAGSFLTNNVFQTMTLKRRDGHDTAFGRWLRKTERIDSKNGYTCSNVDYLWRDYKRGLWMLIEEKRFMSNPSFSQQTTFDVLHAACSDTDGYCGFHLIQFERSSPLDGATYLDGKEITEEELIEFLEFKNV